MSYRCRICDKGPAAGKSISHSHKASNRRFLPNLQKIKVKMSGTVSRIYVCTSCIKAGKITKA